jgi:hypothetical protein
VVVAGTGRGGQTEARPVQRPIIRSGDGLLDDRMRC